MNGALNELRLSLDEHMTLSEIRECYSSFLGSVIHEVEILIRGGSFSTEADLEAWLGDYVDTLEHVFTPSQARVYMGVTRNAEACLGEVNAYERAVDSTFWYQMAYHAQLADLKDGIAVQGLYSWFRREHHAEASRYDVSLVD
jgi:hypothetical protein